MIPNPPENKAMTTPPAPLAAHYRIRRAAARSGVVEAVAGEFVAVVTASPVGDRPHVVDTRSAPVPGRASRSLPFYDPPAPLYDPELDPE